MDNGIPIIDLFAGPGGLGEGFSSVYYKNKRVFKIKLSIEKDENAHKTLELRSFFRQFSKNKVPQEYYNLLREPNLENKETLKRILFTKYNREADLARKEAWLAELGSDEYPSELIDSRINTALGGNKEWVLIGGPPCQAYSIVGRSRVGGISEEDHRVYLYKEYIRIIAVHHPSIFVMENVEGLLSAKLNGKKIFHFILKDLQNPSTVFPDKKPSNYRIYSFTTKPDYHDNFGNPQYKDNRDYLIKTENFNIPQKRHRIILLGIRNDININPEILHSRGKYINIKQVIGDLPKIRSGISKSFKGCEIINGKKKRYYEKVENSDHNWSDLVNKFRNEIISWNGFNKNYLKVKIPIPKVKTGSEFLKYKTPNIKNPLYNWYIDKNINGVCNHESRAHLTQDLKRYIFSSMFAKINKRFPRLDEYEKYGHELLPDHKNAASGKFEDRFRVQLPNQPATTITSHISKDGHYFIHYDPNQCRSLTVREAARIQTFPDIIFLKAEEHLHLNKLIMQCQNYYLWKLLNQSIFISCKETFGQETNLSFH